MVKSYLKCLMCQNEIMVKLSDASMISEQLHLSANVYIEFK